LAIIALFVDQGCAASEPSSHADISRQAALFCKKARKKLHSPCNLGRAERAESPPPPKALRAVTKSLARSAVMKFFLLLFVHKKKTFLASLPWASTRSATRAKTFH
jgi:hypothetical protein